MNIANEIAQGDRILLIAESHNGQIMGTVQIVVGQPQNQPHRADVSKLLVHRDSRRHGVGSSLMAEVDIVAARSARTLLVLDTETGSDAERLYLRSGWTRAGVIPDYVRLQPWRMFAIGQVRSPEFGHNRPEARPKGGTSLRSSH